MDTIANLKRRWSKWFGPKNQVQEPAVTVSKLPREYGKLKLSDVFESKIRYDFIMDVLIKNHFISKVTHQWIDTGKGYKQLIIVLLKFLEVQGYYKLHTKLTNESFEDISYNTFGIVIGIDHIKHNKHDSIIINYIPPAYTIPIAPDLSAAS